MAGALAECTLSPSTTPAAISALAEIADVAVFVDPAAAEFVAVFAGTCLATHFFFFFNSHLSWRRSAIRRRLGDNVRYGDSSLASLCFGKCTLWEQLDSGHVIQEAGRRT